MINWHRLFGLMLMDFFSDSPFEVELEKDLSLKQQYLDVVIVRKRRDGWIERLPDGLEDLREHNLLSYKSLHEPFDAWALKELTGHYVNYRKQISPSLNRLLPEERFRLYGVCTRHPEKLSQQVALQQVKPGVYDIAWGVDTVRLLVLSELTDGEHNAVLRLFSAQREAVLAAQHHYRIRQTDISGVIWQLFEYYQEQINMPYTLQDFTKDYVRDHLSLLSPDDRLKDLSPDDRLKDLSPDDRLKDLSPDDVLKRYSPDDILSHLSPEALDTLREKLRQRP